MRKQFCPLALFTIGLLAAVPSVRADIIYNGIDFQEAPAFWGEGGGVELGAGIVGGTSYTDIIAIPDPIPYFQHFYGHDVTADGVSPLSDTALIFEATPGGFGPQGGDHLSNATNFADWTEDFTVASHVSQIAEVFFSPGATSGTETRFYLLGDLGPTITSADYIAADEDLNSIISITAGHGVYVNVTDSSGMVVRQILAGDLPADQFGDSYSVVYLENGDHILSEAPEPASAALFAGALGMLALLLPLSQGRRKQRA